MGASSGIGYEVARLFIAEGYHVGVAARRMEPLKQLQALAPTRVYVTRIDVTANNACEQIRHLVNMMRGMDVYCHIAGVGWQNGGLEPEIEYTTVQTNVLGFTRLLDEAFRLMEPIGGHIAVISSIAGTKGLGPAPAYSASKAYQNTYVEALKQLALLRKLPITFSDIRPGFVDTPLLDNARFPMLMSVSKVARRVVKAVLRKESVVVIDWRYALLTTLWRCIPRCLWVRFPLPLKS